MPIDLHMHTTASDGEHAPEVLVSLARDAHLDVIAITDHDSTNGIAPARAAAAHGPRIIAGVELSAEEDVPGRETGDDVHMLGYFIDIESPRLQAELTQFRADRYTRGERIVEKLAALGMPLKWERVLAVAMQHEKLGAGGRPSIGRPHIARALVEAGYVGSTREAFDRFIHNSGPAYVARQRLSPEAAIAMIHAAGGAAVIAHPGLLKNPRAMIERLVPAGLDGIEVYHPDNWADMRLDLLAWAKAFDLVVTGGSDFHGRSLKANRLGQENPPASVVAALEARAARYTVDAEVPPLSS